MKGSLISGESIIYFYGLRDFELNNALKNGLTSYNPTTGEMYIDEQSIQKYKEKSIEVVRYDWLVKSVALNDGMGSKGLLTVLDYYYDKLKNGHAVDNKSAMEFFPNYSSSISRGLFDIVSTNYKLVFSDGGKSNGLELLNDSHISDFEIPCRKIYDMQPYIKNIPKDCIPVSFDLHGDPLKIRDLILRNRKSLYYTCDVIDIAGKLGWEQAVQIQKQEENSSADESLPSLVTKDHPAERDSSKVEDTPMETTIGDSMPSPCRGRKSKLDDMECLRIYRQHYEDDGASIATLAKGYNWMESPFKDDPHSANTRESRIKVAISRGRELTPPHARPAKDKTGR